ncbi:hypothetical protein Csa_010501 [Cucumis sativus]|uniref:Uncharacterized protein n=1 Tax=Cucumis sativus TaxID=3659 RepID=A0A0A0LCW5_CUCSA|nr:hypothetical protein Csa_010501 [Cucumis sativus]
MTSVSPRQASMDFHQSSASFSSKNEASLTCLSSWQPITLRHFSTKFSYTSASTESIGPSYIVAPKAFSRFIPYFISKSLDADPNVSIIF